MERAIFLQPGQPWPAEGDWDRLYFGSEFCPWMVPSASEVSQALEEARERGMSFSLVTPFFFDEAMKRAETILETIPEEASLEVVVNDYGTLRLIREKGWSIEPVLGRLLVKCSAVFQPKRYREDQARYLESGNISSSRFAAFLEVFGIRRVEVDGCMPGRVNVGGGARMAVSFHHPLAFVTLAARCPWRFDGRRWDADPCPRVCGQGEFSLRGDDGLTIRMRGRAQMVSTSRTPREMKDSGADRLVFHPEYAGRT